MADSNSRGSRNRGGFRGRGSSNNWRYNRWRGGRRGQHKSPPKNLNDGSRPAQSSSSNQPRQNQVQISSHFTPVPCPYDGWKHYFPLQDFVPTSRITQQIEWSIQFYLRHGDLFHFRNVDECGGFPLDYQVLKDDETLQAVWPQLSEDLYDTPVSTLAAFSLAFYQHLIRHKKNNNLDDIDDDQFESPKVIKLITDTPFVRARLTNYKKITPMKSLRAGLFGKLVAVSGTVVRASNIKLLCLSLAFQCRTCSGVMTYPQIDGKHEPPARCVLEYDDLQCTGNMFEPLRSSSKNVIVEWQSIRIQENNSEILEVGRIPRSVDCEVTEDLVGTCSPGELVTLVGVVKPITVSESDRGSKAEKNMFTFYLEAVSIHNRDRGHKSDSEGETSDETTTNSSGLLTFTMKDYYAIQKIHEEPSLFSFLVASLCPSIFGNHLVKAGLLLGLFGGNNYKNNPSQSPFSKRSDIHVLIVGDPGLGKSQMLQACSKVSPRGVFVCGNSTTNSGLTVTMTKDGTNGNDYSLEAGALVLSDQGTCCIDEFDKMSGQHQSLLEAMEQQSISIAKAGVVCSLPARTSVLAAANPVGGHYNRAKTVSENIKLGPALLSRFDLVFLLLDQPDSSIDVMLTEHILALHTGKKSAHSTNASSNLSSSKQSMFNNSEVEEKTLKSRLQSIDGSNTDLLPAQLLRKYIAYAREYVHPVLDEEAKLEINDFYVHLRMSQYSNDSTPITARQLESLIRLSQARAKAELREQVTGQDARDVIELVKTSFDDVFKNEFGALDFSRSSNGSGMSSRNEGKKFISVLQSHATKVGKTLFSFDELKSLGAQCGVGQKGNFKQLVETLNQQGYLLNKGNANYKLVVD